MQCERLCNRKSIYCKIASSKMQAFMLNCLYSLALLSPLLVTLCQWHDPIVDICEFMYVEEVNLALSSDCVVPTCDAISAV